MRARGYLDDAVHDKYNQPIWRWPGNSEQRSALGHPLFVFGSPTWQGWLAPFLDDLNTDVDSIFDADTSNEAVARLVATITQRRPNAVILVSHHDTLLRDAEIGDRLTAAGVEFCVHQSRTVSALAYDKRGMTRIAEQIPDLQAIPELDKFSARRLLEQKNEHFAIVIKHNSLTEGSGLRIAHNIEQLTNIETDIGVSAPDYLIQSFISGVEFSVNIVSICGEIRVFEPVSKSFNSSVEWLHPSQRVRRCPDTTVSAALRSRLRDISGIYAGLANLQGLSELEFIVDQDERVWFLELNPRLSATVRMNSLVSSPTIFDSLLELSNSGGRRAVDNVATTRHALEMSLPLGQNVNALRETFRYPDFTFSTRVTITGNDLDDLNQNLARVSAAIRR